MMISENPFSSLTVILANGSFPKKELAQRQFFEAERLVCCDGAVEKAITNGREPDVIVGDLDSISYDLRARFADRLVRITEQETNDLAKAFRYCISNGWRKISILGAVGEREDHSIGNIARMADFAKETDSISLITDYGVFLVATESRVFHSRPGAQISIFSFDPNQEISSTGLKYPLDHLRLYRWCDATLNEALGNSFTLTFEPSSPILVFMAD